MYEKNEYNTIFFSHLFNFQNTNFDNYANYQYMFINIVLVNETIYFTI